MQEREQEGRTAGVNYLMVGWSRARSKLVGEGGEVQQGDWSSDGKAGRRESIRETQIQYKMSNGSRRLEVQHKTTELQSFRDTWHTIQH